MTRRAAGLDPAFFENAFFENALNAFCENAFFENAFFENFAIFWRARSRLYQNEILQENNNSKYAFDSIFQALQDYLAAFF